MSPTASRTLVSLEAYSSPASHFCIYPHPHPPTRNPHLPHCIIARFRHVFRPSLCFERRPQDVVSTPPPLQRPRGAGERWAARSGRGCPSVAAWRPQPDATCLGCVYTFRPGTAVHLPALRGLLYPSLPLHMLTYQQRVLRYLYQVRNVKVDVRSVSGSMENLLEARETMPAARAKIDTYFGPPLLLSSFAPLESDLSANKEFAHRCLELCTADRVCSCSSSSSVMSDLSRQGVTFGVLDLRLCEPLLTEQQPARGQDRLQAL